MKIRQIVLLSTASVLLASGLGCAHHYYAPPPPAAPAYTPSANVQLAERNGYQLGRTDGGRDAYNGYPFSARRTRAYHDTPGYDPSLGPLGQYQNTFRNAYLRGYDNGFYHRQ